MSKSPDASPEAEQPRRKRGRPPGSRNYKSATIAAGKTRKQRRSSVSDQAREGDAAPPNHISVPPTDVEQDEYLAYSLAEEQLTLFSSVLRKLVRRERAEIIRIARELDVAENTVYRWMNGNSEPRPIHLRRLLDVFPNQRESLLHAITQTFGDFSMAPAQTLREIRKDIYHHILELLASIEDDEARFWQITQELFTYALRHLDAGQRGLAISFARLMPPRVDGIHSLREVITYGTSPWPHISESQVYLGSTTLAGTAVALQRAQFWDDGDPHYRAPVEVDLFEHSACAVPVMRGNLISGALIVSSTQPRFFHDPMAGQAVAEYALLMGVALPDRDFYPHASICLRPMPELSWQRERIAQVYKPSILAYAHTYGLSRREAELRAQRELESSFEEQARVQRTQTRDGVSAYDK